MKVHYTQWAMYGVLGAAGLARIFISHSSRDNFEAIAFRNWLVSEEWSADDVFLDLDGIGAGERWKKALAQANERCEAVLFLVSPHSLASTECYVEIRMAEDMGKVILPAILPARVPEDALNIEDQRLAIHRERQIVDASIEPRTATFTVTHKGEIRSVAFHAPTLARIKAHLEQLGISPTSFAWNPGNVESASPYPGLEGFDTDEAALFFGRAGDIARGFAALRKMRRSAINTGQGEILVIQAASGAGKSSFLKAGLWPRLVRDPDFIPIALLRPATGILTGDNGMGRQLSAFFARQNRAKPAAQIHQNLACSSAVDELIELVNAAAKIGVATQRLANPDAPPPTPVLAVDQAEELFAADDTAESQRFMALLASLLRKQASAINVAGAQTLTTPPLVLWTVRADSMDALLHHTTEIGLGAPELFPLPPIERDSYREIITAPLDVANRAGIRLHMDPLLTNALIRASSGADALPLLAYTLRQIVEDNRVGAQAEMTLASFEAGGGIRGVLRKRLNAAKRAAGASDETLHTLFVPRLATWDHQATPPGAKRLVAGTDELLADESSTLGPLAEALVAERLLTRGGDNEGRTTLEVAHEALLRQPPISTWLDEQKDNLRLRDDVLREASEWQAGGNHDRDLVRRGDRLLAALELAHLREFSSSLHPAKNYLEACDRYRGRQYFRALMILITPIVVLQGIVAFLYMEQHWHAMTVQLSEATARDIAAIVHMHDASDDPDSILEVIRFAQDQFNFSLRVLPPGDLPQPSKPFFALLDRTLRRSIANRIEQAPFEIDTVNLSGRVRVDIKRRNAILSITIPRSQTYPSDFRIFLLFLIGSAIILITIAILFVRRFIRRIV